MDKGQPNAHADTRLCATHELVLIHTFAEGNGRVGRLRHILLLSKWSSAFAWLTVELIIHDRQQEYYATLNGSNGTGESTVFAELMLSAIKEAIIKALVHCAREVNKIELRYAKIQNFLKAHNYNNERRSPGAVRCLSSNGKLYSGRTG